MISRGPVSDYSDFSVCQSTVTVLQDIKKNQISLCRNYSALFQDKRVDFLHTNKINLENKN